MPRPKSPKPKIIVSAYVSQESDDGIAILCKRYKKTRSEIIRLLIEDAVQRCEFTPAELAARAAERALDAERKTAPANVFDLRPGEGIQDLQRRWRDTPSHRPSKDPSEHDLSDVA